MIVYVASITKPDASLASALVVVTDDGERGDELPLDGGVDQAFTQAIRWAAKKARRDEQVTFVWNQNRPLTSKQRFALGAIRWAEVLTHEGADHLAARKLRASLPPPIRARLREVRVDGRLVGAVEYSLPGIRGVRVRQDETVSLVGGIGDLARTRPFLATQAEGDDGYPQEED